MQRFVIFSSLLVVLCAAAPQFVDYRGDALTAEPTQIQTIGTQKYRGGSAYLPPPTTPQPVLVHKQFFVVGAPEDKDIINKSRHLVIGRPQKNYRVVFIKAPSSDESHVRYSAEYAPREEKTVIYVLSKKQQELDINDIATPAPTQPSKPEIYFIKYKTPEEAEAAQREIQSKYNELGGTNEYSPEEQIPVTNIIGSLDGKTPDGGYNYRQIQGAEGSVINDFLPPAVSA